MATVDALLALVLLALLLQSRAVRAFVAISTAAIVVLIWWAG
jgi:hypothetical protein